MIEKTKDLAWKEDVPQKPTTAQLDALIASLPNNTANVNIRPYRIYSPNEQVVGEWQEEINGILKKKPVYEKVIFFGQLPNASEKTVNHNISNVDVVISTQPYATDSSGGCRQLPLCVPGQYQAYSIASWMDRTVMGITTGNDRSSWNAVFIAQYTKTTDSWEEV